MMEDIVQEVMTCFLDFDSDPSEEEVRENAEAIAKEDSEDGEAVREYLRTKTWTPNLDRALVRMGGGVWEE